MEIYALFLSPDQLNVLWLAVLIGLLHIAVVAIIMLGRAVSFIRTALKLLSPQRRKNHKKKPRK